LGLVVSLLVILVVGGVLFLGARVVERNPTSPATGDSQPIWKTAIEKVEKELAAGNVTAALQEWRDAYRAATKAGGSEAFIEAGDAYRRIGEIAGKSESFGPQAREIYLIALSRARREECVECLLRIAEAFAALGDREQLRLSLRLAELFARQDPEAEADVRAFTMHSADQVVGAGP
jgi:tetratricopeptide (TPR) repeat protein